MKLGEVCGKKISYVSLDGEVTPISDASAPEANRLFTFYIGEWLVLDPYGDQDYPDKFRQKIFKEAPGSSTTLAVSTLTGKVALASFFEFEGEIHLSLELQGSQVPVSHRGKLRELLYEKRPFRAFLDSETILNLMDHEATWDEVRTNLIVQFRFLHENLEVCRDCYRIVGLWK